MPSSREALARLRASERLRAHVGALVRNHLRLGFLVHEPQPLSRRKVFAYLRACSPVEVDVTLLSIADRLAPRGERSQEAIAAHLELARALLRDALEWRTNGPAGPLRGNELARELGISAGRGSASCSRHCSRLATPARSQPAMMPSPTRAGCSEPSSLCAR